jgi:uncharacterized protein (TIGR02145 family)
MGVFTKYARTVLAAAAVVAVSFPAFSDSGDKQYAGVKIGKQTWMARNLNIETGNSWCYGDNSVHCGKYGRLYDWETARNACPSGWHLPSKEEWKTLVERAGGTKVGGKKLKAAYGWDDDGNGKDAYKFLALPGGYRKSDDDFSGAGGNGRWWTATEHGADNAYNRSMYYNSDFVDEYSDSKGMGFSVRCVKD